MATLLDHGARFGAHIIELLSLVLDDQSVRHSDPESPTELALGDARLVAMRRFVRTHLGNPELRPVMVAAEFGISLRYLHRLFAVTGQSFSEFVFGERLEFCRDKLSSPGCAHQSISDIAMEAGFQSFSHFSRRFRAAFNQSPRDYRNAAGR